jgi:hypothetical protein
MSRRICLWWVCAAAGVLAGCASGVDPRILGNSESQMKLRSMQSRAFDSGDTVKTLKTVVATLQDLGFIVDKSDSALGVASGTKVGYAPAQPPMFARMLAGVAAGAVVGGARAGAGPNDPGALRITVTVRARSDTQLVVRANAEMNQQTISDPKQYQDFFAALEKAMFLTAHQVD